MIRFIVIPPLIAEEQTDRYIDRLVTFIDGQDVRLIICLGDDVMEMLVKIASKSQKKLTIIADTIPMKVGKSSIISEKMVEVKGYVLGFDLTSKCDVRFVNGRVNGVQAGLKYEHAFEPIHGEHVITGHASITRSSGKIHSLAASQTVYVCSYDGKDVKVKDVPIISDDIPTILKNTVTEVQRKMIENPITKESVASIVDAYSEKVKLSDVIKTNVTQLNQSQ